MVSNGIFKVRENMNKALLSVSGGSFLALLPELAEAINQILASGVLPPKVALVLHVVGPILALFGAKKIKKSL